MLLLCALEVVVWIMIALIVLTSLNKFVKSGYSRMNLYLNDAGTFTSPRYYGYENDSGTKDNLISNYYQSPSHI
jgi:hypothetical protein